MRKFLVPMIAVALLAPLASQGREKDKEENPFKNAKVGDYAEYKQTTSAFGKDFSTTMKQTVKEKTDKEVTLEITASFGKKEFKQTQKIDLTKPYDINSMMMGGMAGKKGGGTFEKTKDGMEKLKVGDKTYDCTWTEGKFVIEIMGNKIEQEVKFWTSKSVPTGLVKMESKSDFANTTMELTATGNAK
jgi:hypothetical protein